MSGVVEVAGWVGLLSVPVFAGWDVLRPARRVKAPRSWRVRAAVVTVVSFFVSLQVGELWGRFFPERSLFPGAALGTWGGAAVGILVYELVLYWQHRAEHRIDWLWRASHQMHHSAEALEALGANYFHPLDVALFTTSSAIVLFPVLGLSPEAGAVTAAFLAFTGAFQHANIRTPRWLGYLIQRPESHGIHHERGVHAFNYADLPLWDMVFGTFRNPARWEGRTGFYDGASGRIAEMLVGRDVSKPAVAAPARDEAEPAALRPAA